MFCNQKNNIAQWLQQHTGKTFCFSNCNGETPNSHLTEHITQKANTKLELWIGTRASFPLVSNINSLCCFFPENRNQNPRQASSNQVSSGNQCCGHLGYMRLYKLMHRVSCCWRTPFKIHFIAPEKKEKQEKNIACLLTMKWFENYHELLTQQNQDNYSLQVKNFQGQWNGIFKTYRRWW